jgi:hypothetical protein
VDDKAQKTAKAVDWKAQKAAKNELKKKKSS